MPHHMGGAVVPFSFRARTWALLSFAVFFFSGFDSVRSQELPVEQYYNPECLLQTDSCSAWSTYYVNVQLPEYPGCTLTLAYRTRNCPDVGTGSPHPVEEIIVDYIAWPTPATWPNPGAPCANVHEAYLNTPTHMQEAFLKKLFQDMVVTRFRNKFDLEYLLDSVQAVLNPGEPEFENKHLFRLCNYGKKTYRVINGLCMAAITKPDVPFSGIFGRTEREDEKGVSVAGGPPQSTTNYMRVRYVPCESVSQVPCCVQLLQFCRNPYTWETEMQITGTVVGPTTTCSTSVPVGTLQPGEISTGCSDYCLDYEPEYRTGGQGEGTPDLSGPVGGEMFRAKDGEYESIETMNR